MCLCDLICPGLAPSPNQCSCRVCLLIHLESPNCGRRTFVMKRMGACSNSAALSTFCLRCFGWGVCFGNNRLSNLDTVDLDFYLAGITASTTETNWLPARPQQPLVSQERLSFPCVLKSNNLSVAPVNSISTLSSMLSVWSSHPQGPPRKD